MLIWCNYPQSISTILVTIHIKNMTLSYLQSVQDIQQHKEEKIFNKVKKPMWLNCDNDGEWQVYSESFKASLVILDYIP